MKCPHCGWWLKPYQLPLHLTFHLDVDFGGNTPRGDRHINGRPATIGRDVQAPAQRSKRRDNRKTLPPEARGPHEDIPPSAEVKGIGADDQASDSLLGFRDETQRNDQFARN